MAEWRDILERAADNHSAGQSPFRQQPAGWPAAGRGNPVASREQLARELQATPIPAQHRYPAPAPQQVRRQRASLTQSIVQPPVFAEEPPLPRQEPVARKSGAGREIAALSISVGVVGMAVYGFFALLH
jgi:hypothetical protein